MRARRFPLFVPGDNRRSIKGASYIELRFPEHPRRPVATTCSKSASRCIGSGSHSAKSESPYPSG